MTLALLKKILMGISGMLLLVACQDIPYYSVYKSVDAKGWYASDTLVFRLPEIKEAKSEAVKVPIRIIRDFKYKNLALAVRVYEGKKVISTDTLTYKIYNEDGNVAGKGFPYVEYESQLNHPLELKPEKKYRIKITHIMRMDPFDGVCDVGVFVE